MDDFLTALNSKALGADRVPKLEDMFYGTPDLMPTEDREEMIFKYTYLSESIPSLAREYRVTPNALHQYILDEEIEQKKTKTEEELVQFESEVSAKYKNLRVRLSGLLALHTAKVWRYLAQSEENILLALSHATDELRNAAFVDTRALSSLASVHTKMTDRHALFTNAMNVAHDKDIKGLIDVLAQKLNEVLDDIEGSVYKLPSEEKVIGSD